MLQSLAAIISSCSHDAIKRVFIVLHALSLTLCVIDSLSVSLLFSVEMVCERRRRNAMEGILETIHVRLYSLASKILIISACGVCLLLNFISLLSGQLAHYLVPVTALLIHHNVSH